MVYIIACQEVSLRISKHLKHYILVLVNQYQAVAAHLHAACHTHQMVCAHCEHFACTADEKYPDWILMYICNCQTYKLFTEGQHSAMCFILKAKSSKLLQFYCLLLCVWKGITTVLFSQCQPTATVLLSLQQTNYIAVSEL